MFLRNVFRQRDHFFRRETPFSYILFILKTLENTLLLKPRKDLSGLDTSDRKKQEKRVFTCFRKEKTLSCFAEKQA